MEKEITKILFNNELNYKIYKFNSFDDDFYNIATGNLENKFYILNIDDNGIKVAERIRKFDNLAEFIFFTTAEKKEFLNEYSISSIKSIGFFDKNEINLLEDKLIEFINNFSIDKVFKLNTISSFNIIKIKDILFVETKNRKTIIHTQNSIIKTSKNLHFIEDKLKKEVDSFVRTHRACIVNLHNVMSFDFKEKKITFFNNKKCYLLSKSYKNSINKKFNNKYK